MVKTEDGRRGAVERKEWKGEREIVVVVKGTH